MSNEKKDSLQGKDIPSTRVEPEVKSVSVKKPQSFFGERPLPPIENGSSGPALSEPARLSGVWGWRDGSACRRWISPAAKYAQSLGCASKYGLPWEGVVSEQSTAYRR